MEKKLDIKELLRKRMYYTISKYADDWVNEVAYFREVNELWLIAKTNLFCSIYFEKASNKIREKYKVTGIYSLGKIYGGLESEFSLFRLERGTCKGIKMSVWQGNVYEEEEYEQTFARKLSKSIKYAELYEINQDNYTKRYCDYLEHLEQWINTGEIKQNQSFSQEDFFTVDATELKPDRLYSKYYCKEARETRERLKKEEIVKLGDIAEIIRARSNDIPTIGHAIKEIDLEYPFSTEGITAKRACMVMLDEKDILISEKGTVFFIPEGSLDNRIYAEKDMVVIRCRKINPEYLFWYLKSKIGMLVIESEIKGVGLEAVGARNIRELPIIKPRDSVQKYIDAVETIIHKERMYEQQTKFEQGREEEKEAEYITDILDIEIVHTVRIYRQKQLKNLLDNDIRELNSCFKSKAYKATLILAGSILEAVLIGFLK